MKRYIYGLLCMFFAVSGLHGQRVATNGKNLSGTDNTFQQVEGQYVQVNGISMYYESYGEGEPLLMIHGNGGSTASFKNQIKFFSRKYHVIVADSRGQGKTNNTADSLTYDLMAKDYDQLLNSLGIDSAFIIGHSDGGIIGLILAMDYPEKVKMLVTAGANLWPDTTAIQPIAIEWVLRNIKNDKDSIRAGKTAFKSDLLLMNLMLHHPDIDPEALQQIQIPVLVMCGDRDMIKIEHTVLIYQHIPKAQLDIFPGSTHFIPQESPGFFNNSVMRFFTKPFVMPDPMGTIDSKEDGD